MSVSLCELLKPSYCMHRFTYEQLRMFRNLVDVYEDSTGKRLPLFSANGNSVASAKAEALLKAQDAGLGFSRYGVPCISCCSSSSVIITVCVHT